jgi:hydroxyacylglutathione hydrolase
MDSHKMIVKQIEIGPMMNFIYLLGCTSTRQAAVIDPAWDASVIMETAGESGLTISHILLTHGHPDHMNALDELSEATNAVIVINSEEVEYMQEVSRSMQMSTGFMNFSDGIQQVSDGDIVRVGELSIKCVHTPGHSPGSQCFIAEGCLFSGDTLFIDACGRVDMPGGDPQKMWWSLNHTLRSLPDHITIFPGHDYGGSPRSTIGEQKKSNPYMNYDSVQQFVRDMLS